MKAEYRIEVFMPGDMWLLWRRFDGRVDYQNGTVCVRPAAPGGYWFAIPEGPVGAQCWRVRVEIRGNDNNVLCREVMNFASGAKTLAHRPGETIHVG